MFIQGLLQCWLSILKERREPESKVRDLLADRLSQVYMFEINKKLLDQAKSEIKSTYSFVLRELGIESVEDLSENLALHTYHMDFLLPPSQQAGVSLRGSLPHEGKGLIVLGNPPFGIGYGKSGSWLKHEIDLYKEHLNQEGRKQIKGLKALQDIYIKFLRYCQLKFEKEGAWGLIAFVINNYLLDGEVFRGLRVSLLNTFDKIYIVDLLGDPKKKERHKQWSIRKVEQSLSLLLQDGKNEEKRKREKDENIFNIQTGICILFLIKKRRSTRKSAVPLKGRGASVYYVPLWGSIRKKYAVLKEGFNRLPFISVEERPDRAFIPLSSETMKKLKEYLKYPSLHKIFQYHVLGAQSLHDSLVTHPVRSCLEEIIKEFYNKEHFSDVIEDSRKQKWIKRAYVTYHDARDWRIHEALQGDLTHILKNLIKWQWRGMDRWWVAYNPYLMTRGTANYKLLQFLLYPNKNKALLVSKRSRNTEGIDSVFITDTIAESHVIEGGSGIGDYVFPFLINKQALAKKRLYEWDRPHSAIDPNIDEEFIGKIKSYYSNGFSLSDYEWAKKIFNYIYAILWCPFYRERYREFIGEDFPRIPFVKSFDDFNMLSEYGKDLINLHLPPQDTQKYLKEGESLEIFKHLLSHLPFYLKGFSYQHLSETEGLLIFEYFVKKKRENLDDQESMNKRKKYHKVQIGPIERIIWEFKIGGKKQLEAWLTSRIYSERTSKKFAFDSFLTLKEFSYFLWMYHSIKETYKIQKKIDNLFRKSFVSKEHEMI